MAEAGAPSPLHAPPAAGFDDPFEMLLGCHQRIRRFCTLIERIAAHVAAKGCDAEAAQAAGSALRYFDVAGRDHHEDEERDLFPALLEAAHDARHPGAASLVARLEGDHDRLDALWAEVRPRLVALRAGGAHTLPAALAAGLTRAYAEHIDLEEAQLLPLARSLLAPEAVARLGRAMAHRRGARAAV